MNKNHLLSHRKCREKVNPDQFLNPKFYQNTRLPVTSAHTIHPDAYSNEDFLSLERQTLFSNSWILVAPSNQVKDPGDLIVVEVANQSIIVTRDSSGKLNAFYNVCRHRGTKLCSTSQKNVRAIVCPYHSWGFKLTGECIGTPFFENDVESRVKKQFDMAMIKEFDKSEFGLIKVAVDEWGFFVYINLDENCESLSTQIGDMGEVLKNHQLHQWELLAEKDYEINANWKLLLENGIEYYHLPWVHPSLSRTSKVEDHHRKQGRGLYSGIMTYPVTPAEGTSWCHLKPVKGLSENEGQTGYFFIALPNVMYFILSNHAFVIRTDPISANRTKEKAWLFSHPESHQGIDQKTKNDLLDFWDLINREDIAIVEKVQKGIENLGFKGGRLCYHFEEPVHRFQNMVIDKILGEKRIPPGDDELMENQLLDYNKKNFGIATP